MSDPYEIRLDQDNLPTGRYLANDAELVSYLKNRGVLVPAVPCSHGNYAPHVIQDQIRITGAGSTYSAPMCSGEPA